MGLEQWASVATIVGAIAVIVTALAWAYNRTRRPWSAEEQSTLFYGQVEVGAQAIMRSNAKAIRRTHVSESPSERKIRRRQTWTLRRLLAARLHMAYLRRRKHHWARSTIIERNEHEPTGRCELCPAVGAPMMENPPIRFWDADHGYWVHWHSFPGRVPNHITYGRDTRERETYGPGRWRGNLEGNEQG
jgi:hypothetical protein